MESDDCPSPQHLAHYLGNRLESDARECVEEHLSHCRDCRRRLVDGYEAGAPLPAAQVSEDLKRRAMELPIHGSPPTPRWLALAAVLVVGLGLAMLLGPRTPESPPDPETLRAPVQQVPRNTDLVLLKPTSNASVTSESLVFEWRGVPGARRYSLSIVDALGDVIYRGTTSEPSLSPSVEAFKREREYFWYVTTVLDDGTQLESEVWSFRRDTTY